MPTSWENEEDCIKALSAVETASKQLRDVIATNVLVLFDLSTCSIALQMSEIICSICRFQAAAIYKGATWRSAA